MNRTRTAALALLTTGAVALALPSPAFAAHLDKKPKAPTAAQLKQLSSRLSKAEKGSFKVVYKIKSAAQNTTITIAQAPPKRYFGLSTGAVIDTGSATYYCTTTGTTICIKSSTSNPLAGLEDLVNPAGAITALGTARSYLSQKLSGYKISYSSKRVAGQPSTCVNTSAGGVKASYCVTASGLLASQSAAGESFTMVSFTKSPPASLFTLPAGATVSSVGGIP